MDPVVFNMLEEDPGKVDYSMIGGLGEQIRELRESIELPLMNPELFLRVGIKPPRVSCSMAPPAQVRPDPGQAVAAARNTTSLSLCYELVLQHSSV